MKNGNMLVIANKLMVSKIANSSMKADITRIERIIRIANTSRISRKEAIVSLESKISSDEL